MAINQQVDIEIDKLTRSIENAITGDSFKTEVLELTAADVSKLKKADWLFNWKAEIKVPDKTVYKLVIVDNAAIIQGLVSLQDRGDHVFMRLIESSKFNRGAEKVYLGVPGNLVAFACKLSFDKGYLRWLRFLREQNQTHCALPENAGRARTVWKFHGDRHKSRREAH